MAASASDVPLASLAADPQALSALGVLLPPIREFQAASASAKSGNGVNVSGEL
jgi:hypothetical protein